MLDLGCGRAELALRIIERFGSTVIAVDHSELMLDAARERAEWTGALPKLHLDDTDIREFEADPETFHLTVMLGAGGIDGGMAGICNQLKVWTKGGGYILIGEGYWQRKPHADYVAFLGGGDAEYLDHRGNVQAGVDAGLIPMHATTASMDEWDEYEWKYCALDRALRARAARRSRRAGDARSESGAGATPTCAGAATRWASRCICSTGRAARRLTGARRVAARRSDGRCSPSTSSVWTWRNPGDRLQRSLIGKCSGETSRRGRFCFVHSTDHVSDDCVSDPSFSIASEISSHSASSRASCQLRSPCRASRSFSASFWSSVYASGDASQSSSRLPFGVERRHLALELRELVGERLFFA